MKINNQLKLAKGILRMFVDAEKEKLSSIYEGAIDEAKRFLEKYDNPKESMEQFHKRKIK